MAAFPHVPADPAAADRPGHDCTGLFGPSLAPKNLATHSQLGSFSRGAGARAALRGELFLFCLSVHAGARALRAASSSPLSTGRGCCETSGCRPACSCDPFLLRTVRLVGVALVDRLADRRLTSSRRLPWTASSNTRRFVSSFARSGSSISWPLWFPRSKSRCATRASVPPARRGTAFRGRQSPDLVVIRPALVQPGLIQRGCELALFQPLKAGQHGLHLLPGLRARLPARQRRNHKPPCRERTDGDPQRSGIGRFSQRKDISALVTVFTFGALLNAFGMVSPVYALEAWLSRKLHLSHQAPVLGLIFAFSWSWNRHCCWVWRHGPRRSGRAAERGCCRWQSATATGLSRWVSECGWPTTAFIS